MKNIKELINPLFHMKFYIINFIFCHKSVDSFDELIKYNHRRLDRTKCCEIWPFWVRKTVTRKKNDEGLI